MAELSAVRRGQIWADNDRRATGRTLRIDVVLTDQHATGWGFALCTVLTDSKYIVESGCPTRVGSTTKVALRRFRPTSTGYRLVEDVPSAGEGAVTR